MNNFIKFDTVEEINARMNAINDTLHNLNCTRYELETELKEIINQRDKLFIRDVPHNLMFMEIPYLHADDPVTETIWICFDVDDFEKMPFCVKLWSNPDFDVCEHWYVRVKGKIMIYTNPDDLPATMGEGETKWSAYRMYQVRERGVL